MNNQAIENFRVENKKNPQSGASVRVSDLKKTNQEIIKRLRDSEEKKKRLESELLPAIEKDVSYYGSVLSTIEMLCKPDPQSQIKYSYRIYLTIDDPDNAGKPAYLNLFQTDDQKTSNK
jgi:hypothetical protein